MTKIICEHKDGWVLKEEIVIHDDDDFNDDLEGEFECNIIGCGARKKFKFDVINIQEIKNKKDG